MYHFLFSEVWWMKTIIAALIGAGATIIASVIVYQNKLQKILQKEDTLHSENAGLKDDHKTLQQEHKDLSQLLDVIKQLSLETSHIAGNIENRQIHEIEERAKISATMPNEKTILYAVSAMFQKRREEEIKISELKKTIERLKKENARLREKIPMKEQELSFHNDEFYL